MNQFSGIQLPNDVRSSLLSGLEFIAYFGPWVVIILGFIFLPFIHLALVQIVNEGNKTAKSKTGSSRKKKTTSKKKTVSKTTRKGTAKKSSSRSTGAAKQPRRKREKLPTIEIHLERDARTGRTIRREIFHHVDGTKTETREYDDDIKLNLPPLKAIQGGKSGR
ncbi:hypothetical protein MF625_005072 (plasmid) [Paenibacillus polymyxa]|uniref:hypothetical protein n=1 Tax=Paenibacillus polymyxa TaxID=1406 RepID=UPI002023C7E1|nr:hypothetical protein [Paenibacillus polymyxa]URJ38178.1 hypothetical protein MF625_005072 [Paenibacillus polymyxa]